MAVWVKHSKKTTQNYWGRVEKLLNLPERFIFKNHASLQVKKKEKKRREELPAVDLECEPSCSLQRLLQCDSMFSIGYKCVKNLKWVFCVLPEVE